MNRTHASRWVPVAALAFAACAFHAPAASRPEASATPGPAVGQLPPGNALTLDAGVSDVRVVVESRDSVSWSFETRPSGCAEALIESGRLSIGRRDNHCSTKWDVRVPIIDDVRVNVSVGDIDVSAPADRAIRLRSNVGSVRLRIDGRELHHPGAPGSGDHLDLGDVATLPRIDARTGVGSVRAELFTTASRRSRNGP
jgi:hypothetical protein